MDIFSLLMLRVLGKRNHTFNNYIFNEILSDARGERFVFLSLVFSLSKFTTTAVCRALLMTGLPYSKPSKRSQRLVLLLSLSEES